jgi:sortase A
VRHARHWRFAAVPVTAALLSLYFAGGAAWVPLKAELAQWLMQRSWRESLAGGAPRPPWPWADTTVAAELGAPGHEVRLLVLRGNSGRNLAFGPVLVDSAIGSRDIVINGHRDTHFRFLRELQIGDHLRLSDRDGERWYTVGELEVVDSRRYEMIIDGATERLSLVTCYPFDSPVAGGPLRYVVTAYPLREGASTRRR